MKYSLWGMETSFPLTQPFLSISVSNRLIASTLIMINPSFLSIAWPPLLLPCLSLSPSASTPLFSCFLCSSLHHHLISFVGKSTIDKNNTLNGEHLYSLAMGFVKLGPFACLTKGMPEIYLHIYVTYGFSYFVYLSIKFYSST